jgi:hypothetical protein
VSWAYKLAAIVRGTANRGRGERDGEGKRRALELEIGGAGAVGRPPAEAGGRGCHEFRMTSCSRGTPMVGLGKERWKR